jgi:LysM repeat protein
MRKFVIALIGAFVLVSSVPALAQSRLKGSRTAMKRQNSVAQHQDYTFLRTSGDVQRFVEGGLLVRVQSTSSLKLASVSFPYARPAIKLFAERLSEQYRDACGNKLVITSLTRPLSRQPRNASDLSVHPAGMALDIRVSERRACRKWLESTLVELEQEGVLEATRERRPAHYHVAVFPSDYERYVAAIDRGPTTVQLAAENTAKATEPAEPKVAKVEKPTYASIVPLPSSSSSKASTHKVRSGESLWTIARKNGVSVTALKRANDLRSSTIKPGQVLSIPRARSSNAD